MRRLAWSSTIALFLAASATVLAAPPSVVEFDFTENSLLHCGAFDILIEGEGSARITLFFDKTGTPIREDFFGRYKGSLTNSVTGYQLFDAPSTIRMTTNFETGTLTQVGAWFTVTAPGAGTLVFEAGRLVFDGPGPPVFIAGQHLPPPDQIAALCSALDH
jgi:hypothetical protein